jgi:hypothetical protein
MMDLSYTINTRSTCYVSSIGLRNLIPRQLRAIHRPLLRSTTINISIVFTQVRSIFNLYFTYQFIIWKWFSSFDNTVGSMSVKGPLGQSPGLGPAQQNVQPLIKGKYSGSLEYPLYTYLICIVFKNHSIT